MKATSRTTDGHSGARGGRGDVLRRSRAAPRGAAAPGSDPRGGESVCNPGRFVTASRPFMRQKARRTPPISPTLPFRTLTHSPSRANTPLSDFRGPSTQHFAKHILCNPRPGPIVFYVIRSVELLSPVCSTARSQALYTQRALVCRPSASITNNPQRHPKRRPRPGHTPNTKQGGAPAPPALPLPRGVGAGGFMRVQEASQIPRGLRSAGSPG